MKQVGGVWLPDHETHLVEWMTKKNQVVDGKLTYQLDKQNAAYSFCKQFRHAIDIGAHCGLWSMVMALKFDVITAFEPVAEHRQCYMKNIPGRWDDAEIGLPAWQVEYGSAYYACSTRLFGVALGETTGSVRMETADTSSGDTAVAVDETGAIVAGDVPLRRLDDILPDASDVDLIKLDCEGTELLALRGGENLLSRCRPVVCVEQKPGKAQRFGLPETGAVQYLESLGAKLRKVISGDYFLSWD